LASVGQVPDERTENGVFFGISCIALTFVPPVSAGKLPVVVIETKCNQSMGSAKCYGVQAAVNEIEITKVILNRGNWEFRPRVALPVSLKFGQVLALDSQDCSLLEAHIQTDQGTWEFSLGDDSRMHPIQFQSEQITEVIEGLATALELYRLDIGRFPSTSEGLQALTVTPNGVNACPSPGNPCWNGPYWRGNLPLDPWGRPYRSQYSGTGKQFDLFTYGRDDQEGGSGQDSDVGCGIDRKC